MSKTATSPVAARFMQKKVKTIAPDVPLADVIQFLQKHGLSNAPVVEKSDGRARLVGFLSERDCLAALSKEAFFGDPAVRETAKTMMRTHPICVAPDTELFALASIFVNHGFRHLPVVENDELVGMVSRRDILQALDKYYRQAMAEHDDEHFPPDFHELVNHRFIMQGR